MSANHNFRSFAPSISSIVAPISSIVPIVALNAVLLVAFSACTSFGTSDVLGSAATTKKAAKKEFEDLRAYCPKISIRAGTETLRVYPKGIKKDTPDASKKLRFQATIQEVVRECNYISETLAMRVGIAGKVINGPTGESGDLQLPIRIVVTRGEELLYSQLHKITTNIETGRNLAKFRFVDEAVNIDKPESKNILIRVGFDEGPYDTP
jgi:hypothetical protein